MTTSGVFETECLVAGAFPMLCHHQPGDPDLPLLVLAPGGGHLARIFYGHPGSCASDFLCYWLARRGYELLVLSYPSAHPANPHVRGEMTVGHWASAMVDAAAHCVESIKSREVVLVGWSMAGRLAHAFRAAARCTGIHSETFVGLAATAPLPNLTSPDPAGEPLTVDGLWDHRARDRQWAEALEQLSRFEGRLPFSMDDYLVHYRCDNPVLLRGEPRTGLMPPPLTSAPEMWETLGSFDYANYPFCGAVVPSLQLDSRHVLTDRATWGFINAQRAWFDARALGLLAEGSISEAHWQELRRNVAELPDRLTRNVPGGHFFFLGERGAQATAAAVADLVGEVSRFRQQLRQLRLGL